ncbi:hypothetical protein [Neolewinella litorea]|uniref:Uncharacterized protein n=1 Tax=Neolewinella litorea TaxID=2562452 RepID=A0A4S4NDD3_9BACT|nr:hypothetical protein [Neolewinella litorea]THH36537.1 hypothetical protein E4021_14820 [Neolewinella litorea]
MVPKACPPPLEGQGAVDALVAQKRETVQRSDCSVVEEAVPPGGVGLEEVLALLFPHVYDLSGCPARHQQGVDAPALELVDSPAQVRKDELAVYPEGIGDPAGRPDDGGGSGGRAVQEELLERLEDDGVAVGQDVPELFVGQDAAGHGVSQAPVFQLPVGLPFPVAEVHVTARINPVAGYLHRAKDGLVRRGVARPLCPVVLQQSFVVGYVDEEVLVLADHPVLAARAVGFRLETGHRGQFLGGGAQVQKDQAKCK